MTVERILVPIFRLALLCYPRHFRRRYGHELTEVFRAGLRGRAQGRTLWGARASMDAVAAGIRMRRRGAPDARAGAGIGDAWRGLRQALRTLGRSPGLSLAAVVVLALGIGANTAIFSAVRTVILAPPPFPDPERVLLVDLSDSSRIEPAPPRAAAWSYPKYRILEESLTGVTHLAAFARRSLTLTGAGDAVLLPVEVVTPDYFGALGVAPALGRDFVDGDDTPEADPVVILSHGLWSDRFGRDPDVQGRTVQLDGRPVTVVGVAAPGFRGLTGVAQAWVTVHTQAALTVPFLVSGAQAHWLRAVARLGGDATPDRLEPQLRALGRQIDEAHPREDPDLVSAGTVEPLVAARASGEARRTLMLLLAASGLLLLTACANLAGLLTARAAGRQREMAVRRALGAGRARIAGAFLAESLLLSLAGGVAAVAVARVGVTVLSAAWPDRFVYGSWNVGFVRPESMAVDLPVLGYALALALVCGLVFGLLPAFVQARRKPGTGLGGRRAAGRSPGSRLRQGLVAAEVALAVVLVVGAGLLLRSMAELQEVPRGFRGGNLLAFNIVVPRSSPRSEDPAAFHREALERFTAIPGVVAGTTSCAVPMGGHCWIGGVRRAGSQRFEAGSGPRVGINPVGPRFFETLGIEVVRGRVFDDRDRADSPPVAVLSAAAARRLFPDSDPLGRTVEVSASLTPEEGPGATVIGVVGDVLYDRPEQGSMPEVYLDARQEEGSGTFLLRTTGEPLAVVPAVRAALAEVDPDVPAHSVRTLEDLEGAAVGDTRILGGLLAIFAGLALALAVTGVWAVVANGVSRRTQELGLRMALGAKREQVVRLVLRQDLAPLTVGLAVGLGVAWGAGRFLESVLFGVGSGDPATFAGTVLLLLMAGVAAAWLPARRATRLQPLDALRVD